MKCPFCGSADLKVVDKRDSEDIAIRRRRECNKCEKRFTTYERIENIPLIVIKKDGSREQFSREKLLMGLQKACEKRPITQEQLHEAVNEIDGELRSRENTEVPSKDIGLLVMKKLRKLDKVAYIRFASVYREFTDIAEFEQEVQKLMK
ncbi:transcriptional regulator NrdR [Candidatus Woesearchaeota archaeon]|nr:transcriptional regulator NrdR [Candidatus Woesearchaeota archaeon]